MKHNPVFARPNRHTKADFVRAGSFLSSLASMTIDDVNTFSDLVLKPENYTHLPHEEAASAMDADRKRIKRVIEALEDLGVMGIQLSMLGLDL